MPAGVPNTDTFSMQDVVTEIGSGDDLQELFSLATGTFDPAYEGDKTNLLNFRNYIHETFFPFFEPWDDFTTNNWVTIGGPVANGNLEFITTNQFVTIETDPILDGTVTVIMTMDVAQGIVDTLQLFTSTDGVTYTDRGNFPGAIPGLQTISIVDGFIVGQPLWIRVGYLANTINRNPSFSIDLG